ncbi:2-polyprenyl-6-methoxyphenol hydroxylase-like oxidoreductase [Rivularia sp. PCC 7116]|uniref:FAD-dependent oxidoreductase n=1 Tax=Rivularia sp. PCC 7116 TaxID=373994 RepID=UPI00029F0ED7|nr:NAD(P)/FAD-dependent oxidoreductase [Rivularia sp. PCC 7116]AFY52765.1 2-polyprenyl-6-methoxyphenol hydroxylase-like oxidoreductase [Rivularia sp. PCC 7116]
MKIAENARQVLIIGGGPAGLATALILAKRGFLNITVLEKRPSANYYEPDKSFNYLIDGRGQKLIDYIEITDKLVQNGVSSTDFYLTKIESNGNRKTLKLPIVDPNRKAAFWITRQTFVGLLYEEIQNNWQNCINIVFNSKCIQIEKNTDGEDKLEKIQVTAEIDNSQNQQFQPFLLVGCDGINSIVRNTLKKWDDSPSSKFEMKYFPSPSSGLKYKILTLPPKFPLDENGEELSNSEMAYAIRSKLKDKSNKISLGLLPVKNTDEVRSANIITKPNHNIWKLKDGKEMHYFLNKSFPQLPMQKIVSLQEAERFAASGGGEFPIPQYCNRFYSKLSDEAFIVLLGDAIHSFPPDLGQGVNSALEDVCTLNEALEKSKNNLSEALPLYESARLPDTKALIRLMQVGYPWQYNQAPLRKKLWSVNFLLRLALSKLLPFAFSPPAFFLVQNHQLSYSEILAKAERTTRILHIIIIGIVLGLLSSSLV